MAAARPVKQLPQPRTSQLSLADLTYSDVGGTRVVYVIDERQRQGWAYGTLPGHPETGEEAFVVAHLPDDRVEFSIRAFSKPSTALIRLASPLNRAVQSWMTTRYLQSLLPSA